MSIAHDLPGIPLCRMSPLPSCPALLVILCPFPGRVFLNTTISELCFFGHMISLSPNVIDHGPMRLHIRPAQQCNGYQTWPPNAHTHLHPHGRIRSTLKRPLRRNNRRRDSTTTKVPPRPQKSHMHPARASPRCVMQNQTNPDPEGTHRRRTHPTRRLRDALAVHNHGMLEHASPPLPGFVFGV